MGLSDATVCKAREATALVINNFVIIFSWIYFLNVSDIKVARKALPTLHLFPMNEASPHFREPVSS